MTRPTLFIKILRSMLMVALLPLFIASLILAINLSNVRERLSSETAAIADRQAADTLRQHAEQVAKDVSELLTECEGDLHLVTALPRSPRILKAFYDSRSGEIWRRAGTRAAPREVHEWIPRYSELAIIDRNGTETFAIRDGRIVPRRELRNVANPADTEFRSEEYFRRTRELRRGEIYVSHLTGFHVSREEQLAGAKEPEDAYGGKEYRGVIRFATPLYKGSRFAGIVVLSLDQRLLMEFTQHISPGQNRPVVFPSYKSGNYAFMFDDEGWIITHPKYWDIRGVDEDGRAIPPYTARSAPADIERGEIPFNLDAAGFIHPNYPVVAREVRKRLSGYVDITNVGGAKKLMAFAPIIYATGDYRKYGVFGGVTIGFQADQFREAARAGVSLIGRQVRNHFRLSTAIICITAIIVVIAASLLSRGITRPLALLAEGARRVASGETGQGVEIHSDDEIGDLAANFNTMAEELELRKQRLLKTLEELSSSRQEIMAERNFKESVLESIFSGILTFSRDGRLSSVNTTGRLLLGPGAVVGAAYADFLAGWGEIPLRIGAALAGGDDFGRRPVSLERDGVTRYFDVGVFPIGDGGASGITVTIRDETEKEKLREEMMRLDRFASLGKLSAGIAHEVRNPLTGISLLLDDLHDRAAHDPESQTMMRKALAEIERVERLIAALLNFSSPPKAEFREGELNRVVQDTELLLGRECERHGVTLHFAPGEIPPFRFDVEKIKQALLNLVKNAMEALPKGGDIRIATAADRDAVTITVADTGPGIPPADLPLIFEPFFTRKGAGTGLGLSITHRIVTEHHGKITVESRTGAGTTFTIVLPRDPFGGMRSA